jgi:hypothetical protein
MVFDPIQLHVRLAALTHYDRTSSLLNDELAHLPLRPEFSPEISAMIRRICESDTHFEWHLLFICYFDVPERKLQISAI